jgi:5'-deoxynucleotidase YfbR-like HD superfamily hydrolase
MSQYANYLNEVGMLNRTPRSGFQFLGGGDQSVAEHIYRMMHVAFLLARMSEEKVDEAHILRLVMFHDLPEARTSDHNYVNRKYVQEDLERVLEDGASHWPFGDEIAASIREFEAAETPAARLAKDADQLELLLVMKEQGDLGHPHVDLRLRTNADMELAQEIFAACWDEVWRVSK